MSGPRAADAEPDGAPNRIAGTAVLTQELLLPPGAVFEARLEDVSIADARAVELGRTTIAQPGESPIGFTIEFDPGNVDPRHRYAVRAQIRVDGELWFTSDSMYPVLTPGAGRRVELALKSVRRNVQPGAAP
jgi:putative lipoprotein